MDQKKLEIHRGALDDAALAAYARAYRHDTSGGLASLEEILTGAEFFEVVHAGLVVLRYALRVEHKANGSEGVIVAASGAMRGVDLTAAMLPAVEHQFTAVRSIRCDTARPGLVGKMAAHGYAVESYRLRKRFEH
jgi:hypothetical protein